MKLLSFMGESYGDINQEEALPTTMKETDTAQPEKLL